MESALWPLASRLTRPVAQDPGPGKLPAPVAKTLSPIVLILGHDSLRADRALAEVFKFRAVDPAEVVRIWGDESSLPDVFAAATSRSLFSDKTVVVVKRAERLRGAGVPELDEETGDEDEDREEVDEQPRGRKVAGKAPSPELPELDPSSVLILMARKVDRRIGIWKKINKVAEAIEVDYLKGKSLTMAAAAEARALGLRVSDAVLQEMVEQSGPSLGRIVSELEKMLLYQGTSSKGADDIVAVTSSPPLYLLSDALMEKNKRRSLGYLDDALRQGEAGLKVLATLHGTIRRMATFRALRSTGVSATDAGTQLGIMPFKVMDTDRAARNWSEGEIGRALSTLAEADRRLKLGAPAVPLLTHALARMAGGGRA